MIIEFNGLPGTGKTTIAHELENILVKQGFECCYKYDTGKSKIKRYFSYVSDGSLYLYYLGICFAKSLKGSFRKENLQVATVLVYFYQLYKAFNKNCRDKILIIDQGIIQGLISLAHTQAFSSPEVLDKILRFFKKKGITFMQVNCLCDSELSLARIRERNTTAGRLDTYNDAALADALKKQSENFDVIRNCAANIFECIDIDTHFDPRDNAASIYSVIEAKL